MDRESDSSRDAGAASSAGSCGSDAMTLDRGAIIVVYVCAKCVATNSDDATRAAIAVHRILILD
jgi:hypothetical protein